MLFDDYEMLKLHIEQGEFDKIELKPISREQNNNNSFNSALMLSAHNLKHLNKIPSLRSDCIILNLEDGVSKELKPLALKLCALTLSRLQKTQKKLVVRVNALEEGGDKEIEFLNSFKPDAIRVPKIKSVADIKKIESILDDSIELHISIETSASWVNLNSLAEHKRVRVFYLGILDLFADLGLSQTLLSPVNPTLSYILSHFLVSSLAHGVKPVSFVYQDYKNLDEFSEYLKLEKSLGFDAKVAISPDQVELINAIFKDKDSELHRARDIVEKFEKKLQEGVSGFVDEKYGFIDEPIYKDALNSLQKSYN